MSYVTSYNAEEAVMHGFWENLVFGRMGYRSEAVAATVGVVR